MTVDEYSLSRVIERLKEAPILSCDTETTGLRPFQGDRLFSIIFADSEDGGFYFNFNHYPEDPTIPVLDQEKTARLLRPIFADPKKLIYFHNAKFDMHMLEAFGIDDFSCQIHDTYMGERLISNALIDGSYSLDSCLERMGLSKGDGPKKWCDENKEFEYILPPGKKQRVKKPFFWLVPFEIMQEYGLGDATGTFALGEKQREIIEKSSDGLSNLLPAYKIEKDLTKACFEIERAGVLVDREYCKRKIEELTPILEAIESQFEEATGYKFIDSAKTLSPVFRKFGITAPKTEKGNDSFKDDVLEKIEHPVADAIRKWRGIKKIVGTYYHAFLYYADRDGFIHASMMQAGTKTGRFSYREPNLQNIPKRGDGVEVRRAFIPRPGNCLVALDYDQMEFRLMLDYAKEFGLIEKIKNGHDPHTAVAEETGLSRSVSKTLNFGLLYGMGVGKLAVALGVSESEARAFKEKYFARLPKVKALIKLATNKTAQRGYIVDWTGRKLSVSHKDFAYKGPNLLIQGGCAMIAKIATERVVDLFKGTRSNVIIQVHDELVLDMHPDDLYLIPRVKEIMEAAYTPNREVRMPLTVGVSHSWKSWGEMIEGEPKARDEVFTKSCEA